MDKFVPAFEKFIEFNDEILTAWKATQVDSTDDQIIKRFKLFKKTIDPRTHDTHMEVIKEAFNQEYNRIFSSSNVLDDEWLVNRKKDKLLFTFGTQEKYSLMVSDIYQRALDMSASAESIIDEQCGDETNEDIIKDIEDNFPEINYPDQYLLQLYSVFETTQGRAVKNKLNARIKALRHELGEITSSMGDPSSMMKIGTDLFKTMGETMGIDASNMNMPSAEDLPGLLQSFNGQDMQKFMSGALENFSKAGDLGAGARLTAEQVREGKYGDLFNGSAMGEMVSKASEQLGMTTGLQARLTEVPLADDGSSNDDSEFEKQSEGDDTDKSTTPTDVYQEDV